MTLYIKSPDELPAIAEKLLESLDGNKIILFYGDMGVGKTTFIKAICETLGVTDMVSSPTFSIINEYSSPQGPIYHFDFYRLMDEQEAMDIGCEDYLYSGAYCFVEWPEMIPNLLPEHYASVSMGLAGTNQRIVIIETI